MNILVLGGNGYLGTKIVNMLAEEGHTVYCTIRDEKIRELYSGNNIKGITPDYKELNGYFKNVHFDLIFNAACNYGRSEVIYGDVIEANIEFPLKVLDSAVANGVKNYITIGTGLPDRLNMYSYSKKMFSEFGRFYVEKKFINFINMKLEMFYGYDEPADRFIPSTIRKMLRGDVVNVTAGTQHRDIICIDDILKAIKAVIYSQLKGYHEVFVGTGVAPTISELIDYMWEKSGKKSIVNKGAIPMRPNEPDCVADTSVLCSLTEWNPIYWKDGIGNMIDRISGNL